MCVCVYMYVCMSVCVLALQRGGEEMVTHQLTAQTAHVHSTGGDKQVLNVHTRMHACMDAHTYTETAYNTLSSQCPHGHIHTRTNARTHIHIRRLVTTHFHPNVHTSTHRHTQAYQHMTRLHKSQSHTVDAQTSSFH